MLITLLQTEADRQIRMNLGFNTMTEEYFDELEDSW